MASSRMLSLSFCYLEESVPERFHDSDSPDCFFYRLVFHVDFLEDDFAVQKALRVNVTDLIDATILIDRLITYPIDVDNQIINGNLGVFLEEVAS